MERAYSLLEIKSVEADRRTFAGIASTPELDRQGDMVDPAGVRFRNPVPLLYHHDPTQPIGTATLTVTADGILFEASLPVVDEPGPLKTRVDDAWQCIKAGIITGVSIGHRPLKDGYERLHSGARKLKKTEVCELSLVTIPANANAQIYLVKSLAAPPRQEKPTMSTPTATEFVQNIENKRAAHVARMADIMKSAADDNRTLVEDEATEHDGLAVDVKKFDDDLCRWRALEKLQIKTATVVPTLTTATGYGHVSVRPNVEPGIKLARWVIAKMVARYENCDAASIAASRWNDSTPEVALALKAAVAAGTYDGCNLGEAAGQPVDHRRFSPAAAGGHDRREDPRPRTACRSMSTCRRKPPGGTINWVGELKPKPVTAMAFAMETLAWAKVAAIVVLSQELVRFSNPSAERLVRDSLVKDIATFLDAQFIDPAVAAVAGVNPASITNGAPTAAATANPLADHPRADQPFRHQQHSGGRLDVHHVARECAGAVVPHELGRLASSSLASASAAARGRA